MRLIVNLYGLQVSRSLKIYKAIKLGIECTNNSFSQILCLQVIVRLPVFTAIAFKSHTHVHDFSKKII